MKLHTVFHNGYLINIPTNEVYGLLFPYSYFIILTTVILEVKVAQSCPTFCDPMDYTVYGILQARILKWVTFPFSRQIFPTQSLNPGLLHCRWILYQLRHQGNPRILEWVACPFSRGSSWPGSPARVSCKKMLNDKYLWFWLVFPWY